MNSAQRGGAASYSYLLPFKVMTTLFFSRAPTGTLDSFMMGIVNKVVERHRERDYATIENPSISDRFVP